MRAGVGSFQSLPVIERKDLPPCLSEYQLPTAGVPGGSVLVGQLIALSGLIACSRASGIAFPPRPV